MASARAERRAWVFWIVLGFVLSAGLANAQNAVLDAPRAATCLKWSADVESVTKGCPSRAELESAVEAILGRKVFVAESCELVVEVSVRRAVSRGWIADVSFSSPGNGSLGTRRLEGPANCTALRGPISLVIALMLEARQDAVVLSESTEPAAPVPRTSAQPRPSRGLAFGDLRATYGLLPDLSLGIAAGAGMKIWDGLTVHVEGTFWSPKATAAEKPGGRFWAWHAGPSLCPELASSRSLQISSCLGAQLGMIHANGFGLDDTERSERPYAHAEARLVMSFPVWRSLSLLAEFGATASLIRPRFVYLDQTESVIAVHRPNASLPFGGFGLIWRDIASTPLPSPSSSP